MDRRSSQSIWSTTRNNMIDSWKVILVRQSYFDVKNKTNLQIEVLHASKQKEKSHKYHIEKSCTKFFSLEIPLFHVNSFCNLWFLSVASFCQFVFIFHVIRKWFIDFERPFAYSTQFSICEIKCGANVLATIFSCAIFEFE